MRLLSLLLILSITLNSCFFKKSSAIKVDKSKSFSKIFKSTDNELRYKSAEQFYTDKKYNLALQLYEDLFPYIKGSDRYEDMYFKSANCYYFLKDYLNAENFYKTFVETFPNSKRSEDASYLRAFSYYKQSPKVELDQTPTVKAMALMQAFISMYPTSLRAKEANEIIDNCRQKLETKEFKAAELYYNLGYYKSAAIRRSIHPHFQWHFSLPPFAHFAHTPYFQQPLDELLFRCNAAIKHPIILWHRAHKYNPIHAFYFHLLRPPRAQAVQ